MIYSVFHSVTVSDQFHVVSSWPSLRLAPGLTKLWSCARSAKDLDVCTLVRGSDLERQESDKGKSQLENSKIATTLTVNHKNSQRTARSGTWQAWMGTRRTPMRP